jgi:oligopeptide/dipeptide ABC transporter ATP-binding protein
MTMQQPILQAEGLSKIFGGRRRWFDWSPGRGFPAVSDLSFSIARGETLGIVGESGSGKSTTARMLLRLVEPSSGRLLLDGEDLRGLGAEALRVRRRGIQMVFQDPFSSLNPRIRVGAQIGEPLHVHRLASGAAVGERVAALMSLVGLDPARMQAYPHEFSGGQRQRIAIARALASEPKLIVADEAVSALDVSVRAQILNLFDDLKRASDLALIFISHDLGVVRHLVDRVAVMYRGRIVEIGPTVQIFASPRHPYTRTLLSAIPVPMVGARRARVEQHQSLDETASGCPYATRCPLSIDLCRREMPALVQQSRDHLSACFRAVDVPPIAPASATIPTAAAERLRRLQARFATSDASVVRAT